MEAVLVLPMEYTMAMREDTRMVLTKETDQHIKKETHSSEDIMMEVCNKVISKLSMSVSMSLRRIPSKMIQTLNTKSLLPG